MSTLIDFMALIDTLGLGTENVDTFLGELPDTPDTAVALRAYAGPVIAIDRTHDALGLKHERPRVQIVSRSKSYLVAETKLLAIYRQLMQVANETVNGKKYISISPVGTPMAMPRDGRSRVMLVVNMEARKEV